MTAVQGPLAGVRVVDLTDERAIYGAKLLADLGADVVRPEPPDGDPLRSRGPHFEAAGGSATSLWHAFFASNRRFFSVDLTSQAGISQLEKLVQRADIVLTSAGAFGVDAVDLNGALARQPDLMVVDTSSFGKEGPWTDYLAPDLIAGALGGQVATTGDANTSPLKTFGELNFMVSGVYVAIAALGGLFLTRQGGPGQRVHVSVHECIASCLEQVFMFYWYHDALGHENNVLPRQGATHWSNSYTVFPTKQGSIMVTPAPDFDAQLAWLIEEGVHDDLIEPKYMEPENLGLRVTRTMEILKDWVAAKEAAPLFFEAQDRHAPYGWVLPIENVAENPQLDARKWYVPYQIGQANVSSPGAPYQFSATPWQLQGYEDVGGHTDSVLRDIDWMDQQ